MIIAKENKHIVVFTAQFFKKVDHISFGQTEVLCDLWDQLRKDFIQHSFVCVSCYLGNKWWGNEYVHTRLGVKIQEGLNHLSVAIGKLLLIPHAIYRITSSKRDKYIIWIRLQRLLVLILSPVRERSFFLHTDAIRAIEGVCIDSHVDDFIFFIIG